MELNYIQSEIGKKKLKYFKKIELIYLIIAILLATVYLILCLNSDLNKTIILTFFIIVASLIIKIIKKNHINRISKKTLTQEICLDGFINLHIYYAKKAERKPNNHKFYKAYNYSLLNLIDGYLRKGDFNQVNNIINFLENRGLDNTTKAFLIRYKASIAFNNNDIKEFEMQYKTFNEISSTLVEKIKNQILCYLDLQKYILENNEAQANKIFEQFLKSKLLLNRITASYYKAIMLEKNNNEEYKMYYKFVVENGNDLNIAKIASDKVGIPQKIEYKEKNKFLKFLQLVLIFVLIFSVFKTITIIDTMKQTKEKAKKATERLMDSISIGNYEQIKSYINKPDGTELTDEQISNFLLNTGLYRATIENSGIVSFTANTSFFSSDEAYVIFSYKTLSGNVITNELKYSHRNGLMTDKIQESNKIKERFPIAVDLANGNTIEYNDSESVSEEELSTVILSYVKDDNGKICIEVIKEAKEDLKAALLNTLYSELNSLKKINENYNIVWDNEYKEFSIYYNEQLHNSDFFFGHSYMKFNTIIFGTAMTLQCLDGNEDWRLTINYYDYDTNKLLKTETIR